MIDWRNSMPALRRQFEDHVSRFMASDLGQRVIGWYEQLGTRDRLALRVLAGFVGLLLVYALLLKPMIDYGDRAQRRLQQERDLVAWLRANEQSARQSAGSVAAERDQPVSALVNSSARDNRLTIRRYEPAGEGSVRVWLDGAAFNDVVKWIYRLQSDHGIRTVEYSIEHETSPGRVTARLTLQG